MKTLMFLLSFLLTSCASTPGTNPRLVTLPTAPPPEWAHLPVKDDTITPPKPLQRVDPRPPRALALSWMKATAEIGFVIDEEGRVPAVWYVSGDPQWAKIVMDAVIQWRWQPATRDGEPVAIRSTMTSKFRSDY